MNTVNRSRQSPEKSAKVGRLSSAQIGPCSNKAGGGGGGGGEESREKAEDLARISRPDAPPQRRES